jgi:hypothetical protein
MLSETLDELGYEDIIPLRLRIFYWYDKRRVFF